MRLAMKTTTAMCMTCLITLVYIGGVDCTDSFCVWWGCTVDDACREVAHGTRHILGTADSIHRGVVGIMNWGGVYGIW